MIHVIIKKGHYSLIIIHPDPPIWSTNSGVAPLKENGKMHADPLDKSNILNRQYESTFTQEDETNIPQPEGCPYPPMPDIEIGRDGVLKLLKKINPNKASGPDMIPARILKDLAEELAPFLT